MEKRLAENRRFPAELIHNTDNIISLPVEVHRRISAIMSSKDLRHDNTTRRNWTEKFSFGEQYNMGLNLIEDVSEEMGYEIPHY